MSEGKEHGGARDDEGITKEHDEAPDKAENALRSAQVEVQFWTALGEDYETASDPFLVPTNLARYGLSEVINHLLSRTPEDCQPFEFLIDGEFLRTSLAGYLERKGLTSEVSLSVEYTLAQKRPDTKVVDSQPDWTSKVCWLWADSEASGGIGHGVGCTAAMDGICRIYQPQSGPSDELVVKSSMHLATVSLTAAALFDTGEDMNSVKSSRVVEVVTASKSGEVKFCAVDTGTGVHTELARGISHKDSAECVAISRDGSVIASGGQDGRIVLWNNEDPLSASGMWAASGPVAAQSRPLRKRLPPAPVQTPSGCIEEASAQTITDLQFSRIRPGILVSASLDKTIRCWDTITTSPLSVYPVARAVTSVDVNYQSPNVWCTTHEDGHVRIWDLRSGDTTEVAANASVEIAANSRLTLRNAYNAHNRWVSEARWCPTDGHVLASTSHDGRLNFVDIRLPKLPTQSLLVEGEDVNEILGEGKKLPVKILTLCWTAPKVVATGASDGRLRLHYWS